MTLATVNHEAFKISPAFIDATEHNLALLTDMVDRILVEGDDYGVLPGTKRLSLWKPGAATIAAGMGCHVEATILHREIDPDRGFVLYEHEARVYRNEDRLVVAYGQGACNNYEIKYRYRQSGRSCPNCSVESIIPSQFDPGYYCFPKKGGCGDKFAEFDERITQQETGRVPNPDPLELANTILKMSEKRAGVDAVLALPGVARFFTQDMEVQTGEPETAKERTSQGKPKGNEASNDRRVPTGDTIGTDAAAKIMQMADDLDVGRKWVMDTIRERWDLSDPRMMSKRQMDTIVGLLNGGDDQEDPVDALQDEMVHK